jgi:RNA-directed DNA polymerase
MKRLAAWCRKSRHAPLRWQHTKLSQSLRGHDNYYGVTGNYKALAKLRWWVMRTWWKWLRRRSRGAPRFESVTHFAQLYRLPAPRMIRRLT